jgi:4-amino-4-deoxy-L-arabinose transferase-like glycosyltransferase
MSEQTKISSNPGKILIALLIIYFFTHLYKITDPPNGYHAWRESDTAAVAEAFYKETKNIFQPRIHHRQDKIGITGMEFPIYNYASGMLYYIFGFRHYVPRMLTIIISLLGMLGIYMLSKLYFKNSVAILAVYLTACSPLFFFYGRKIQPDMIILTAGVWAFYFFLRMEDRFSRKYFIISLLLIALGALIKPTALAVGLPLAVYLLFFKYRGKVRALFKPKYFLFLGVSILVPLAWNFYARYLKFKYGLDAFYLGGDQIDYWINTNWPDFFKKVYRTWLFEVYLGIPVAVGLIVGIFSKRRVEPPLKIFFSWILGCFLMFFMVSEHMSNHHDYYGLILIPPLMIVAAYYIENLWGSGKKIFKIIFLMVVIGSAIYVWPRIDQRYGNFTEKDFFQTRKLIEQYIPPDARVTVEDASPSIELYRLGRMGWTFPKDAGDDKIFIQIERGAQYAIFYQRSLTKTLRKQTDILYSDGKVKIYRFETDN